MLNGSASPRSSGTTRGGLPSCVSVRRRRRVAGPGEREFGAGRTGSGCHGRACRSRIRPGRQGLIAASRSMPRASTAPPMRRAGRVIGAASSLVAGWAPGLAVSIVSGRALGSRQDIVVRQNPGGARQGTRPPSRSGRARDRAPLRRHGGGVSLHAMRSSAQRANPAVRAEPRGIGTARRARSAGARGQAARRAARPGHRRTGGRGRCSSWWSASGAATIASAARRDARGSATTREQLARRSGRASACRRRGPDPRLQPLLPADEPGRGEAARAQLRVRERSARGACWTTRSPRPSV